MHIKSYKAPPSKVPPKAPNNVATAAASVLMPFYLIRHKYPFVIVQEKATDDHRFSTPTLAA
jgi:hypothetical protein